MLQPSLAGLDSPPIRFPAPLHPSAPNASASGTPAVPGYIQPRLAALGNLTAWIGNAEPRFFGAEAPQNDNTDGELRCG